ncbi:MAG TPA: FAD-dependent oxidoreductase [Steroidobacteraceae bacterium]|nr:FAD-dependent oxidoreductase [Steroidobacteraceae bacterium]
MSAFPPYAFSGSQLRSLAPKFSRRGFIGGAAAVTAALPAAPLWADTPAGAAPADVAAIGLSGKQVTLTAADIKDLRAGFGGQVLLAQDGGYDQARRVWNGAFDRHPALVARAATTADVARAVSFARAHGLLTAVKGGGHSISGQSTCEGGMMIDLGQMKDVQVDRAARLAKAQGGVLLADVDARTQQVGLVTPLGTASDTGIAGLTLGGGQGRLQRTLGLSCDNVHSYELVTADGKVLEVSASENPDLFWALRGGGGNFGVVTSFEYQLHPLDHPVLAGTRLYPYDKARDVLDAYFELGSKAPKELSLSGGITVIGPNGALPPGKYAAIEVFYSGKPADGEPLIAPLSKLGTPLRDGVSAKPYVLAQLGATGAAPPALPPGLGVYVKSGFLNSVPDTLVSEILHVCDNAPPWCQGIGLGALGGAISQVKPDATAYWNRAAQWDLLVFAAWMDHSQDEHNAQVMRGLWKTFEPFTKGYYVNTEPSESEQRLRATYGDNYPRLVQLKGKYDPDNLFRLNANIRPAGRAGS